LILCAALAGCATRAPVISGALAPSAPASVELAQVPFFPQEEYQCGPAALATLLTYSGHAATPQALAPRVYLPGREGSLQVELVAAVRQIDRIPYVIRPSLPALFAEVQAGRPVAVFQNLGFAAWPVWHFAVVIGYAQADETLLLRSGTDERLRMSGPHFLHTWELGKQWGLVVLRAGELPAADDPDGYLRAVAAKEAVAGAAGLVAAYRAAVQRWPDNTPARFGHANALRASGALTAAVTEYRALLRRAPDDVAALNNLADALGALGCREQALQTIDKALALSARSGPHREAVSQTRQELLSAPLEKFTASAACSAN
jgi:hypothetical protein